MTIRDSRSLYGPLPLADGAEIRAHWEMYGAERGWWNPNTGVRTPGGKVDYRNEVLRAYVSDNRWVADCTCGGGMGCWPEMDRACCYDCGKSYRISFPGTETIAQANAVLVQRPEPAQRNWRVDEGETVADLKIENLTRGYSMGET